MSDPRLQAEREAVRLSEHMGDCRMTHNAPCRCLTAALDAYEAAAMALGRADERTMAAKVKPR